MQNNLCEHPEVGVGSSHCDNLSLSVSLSLSLSYLDHEHREVGVGGSSGDNLSKVLAWVGRRSLENKFITRVMAQLTPSSLPLAE